ncbi:MAG: Gfo/Idh/MocA family protein [Limnochordia bacterium]|jgi:predicted dehydrogenase
MKRNKPFKVALIGTGGVAHAHVSAFRKAGVEVAAVAGINAPKRDAFARQYGIPVQVSDYRELFQMDEIDAIVICLPNFLHAEVAIAAMRAGKHVLTEKPMAIDSAAAAEMVRVQRETNKTLLISTQGRYGAAAAAAKQYAAEFGEIYYGKCVYMRRSGIPGWGSWFTRQAQAGGGPCVDIGVHVLDLCLYFMGYPKPVHVAARTYSKFGVRGQGRGDWGSFEPDGYFDVEDFASALITFENGSAISLETSWAYHGPDRWGVEVFGTEGGLTLSPDSLTVYTNKFDRPVTIHPTLPKDDDRLNMVNDFIECCTTGKPPLTSAEHGLVLTKICDAIYESSAQAGKQVPVDL